MRIPLILISPELYVQKNNKLSLHGIDNDFLNFKKKGQAHILCIPYQYALASAIWKTNDLKMVLDLEKSVLSKDACVNDKNFAKTHRK